MPEIGYFKNRVFCGDCKIIMSKIPDNSIDSIVTDPPAGIAFMNKDWDKDKGGRSEWIDWMKSIAEECLRVIKPGGHALVWSLPRTSHWTGTAWEDAGWVPREKIYHLFGSGFPKSTNISKQIDKCGASEGMAIRREIAELIIASSKSDSVIASVCDVSPALVRFWRKMERNIQKPEAEKLKTILENMIPIQAEREVVGEGKSGKTAIWQENGDMGEFDITAPATPEAIEWEGWGTALKPASEEWWLFRKPLSEKTIASNVLKWGTGGLNIDGCRVETDEDLAKNYTSVRKSDDLMGERGYKMGFRQGKDSVAYATASTALGRFPANIIHDGSEEVISLFPQTTSGKIEAHHRNDYADKSYSGKLGNLMSDRGFGDSGSAARFFYCAKASKKERNMGCDGLEEKEMGRNQSSLDGGKMLTGSGNERSNSKKNSHPTVKSLSLMRYLCKLITPPNGIVLDPFAGSGSTLIGAKQEGFNYIGIEMEEEYIEIIECRLSAVDE